MWIQDRKYYKQKCFEEQKNQRAYEVIRKQSTHRVCLHYIVIRAASSAHHLYPIIETSVTSKCILRRSRAVRRRQNKKARHWNKVRDRRGTVTARSRGKIAARSNHRGRSKVRHSLVVEPMTNRHQFLCSNRPSRIVTTLRVVVVAQMTQPAGRTGSDRKEFGPNSGALLLNRLSTRRQRR